MYLDLTTKIGASAAAAGLRCRRDLRREEEKKRGKRVKEKKREMRKDRERIGLTKRKEEF